ncbi:hypothetical protein ON010_g1467 [Phytophthora cinnamomi]|nr:hypothetical protein ON010_g1467 [Phytophthora cinnamomi]
MQHRVKAILESESIWSLNRLKCQLQPRHSEEVRTNKSTEQAEGLGDLFRPRAHRSHDGRGGDAQDQDLAAVTETEHGWNAR